MARRMAVARAVMDHPRVRITDIEARIGTRFTAATLKRLRTFYPGVRFVWLMGADGLADFHRWDRWKWILGHVPVGVLARPGQRISARTSVAAARFERFRLRGRDSQLLGWCDSPVWCFVNIPMNTLSSSAIRASGGWTD